jgi:ubiquitin-protein ligase E3 C
VTEEGVDGGGLFKEFITKLTEIIFDPHYAFFAETPDRKLYPSYLS